MVQIFMVTFGRKQIAKIPPVPLWLSIGDVRQTCLFLSSLSLSLYLYLIREARCANPHPSLLGSQVLECCGTFLCFLYRADIVRLMRALRVPGQIRLHGLAPML